jgi:hypothetical protein
MKQTAVEYFVEQLEAIGFSTNNIAEFENEIILAKEMEKQEKLKVQIEENESVLEMLRLHGNDSSVMRVFLRLESLKQTFKSE